MDQVEATLAVKRISRWSDSWKADVVKLTPTEREVLMSLVALLDVRPVDGDERAKE